MRDENAGDAVEDVDEHADDAVDPSSEIAGDEPDVDPDAETIADVPTPTESEIWAPGHHPAEQIAPELVGAEQSAQPKDPGTSVCCGIMVAGLYGVQKSATTATSNEERQIDERRAEPADCAGAGGTRRATDPPARGRSSRLRILDRTGAATTAISIDPWID